jgi:hypothetical protein
MLGAYDQLKNESSTDWRMHPQPGTMVDRD